jgi:murein DD-endopeptidase MepM/ murein hydrolase activator NlpD
MARRCTVVLAACAAVLAHSATPAEAGRLDVAALQVALHALRLLPGNVDGVEGRATVAAVRSFQRRSGLRVDGIAGPRTRAALGRRGRQAYGSRTMRPGQRGWDVAGLQYALSAHGFPCGPLDGGFGARVEAAVLRFQRFAGLPPAGVAGPATRAALRRPPPRAPLPVRLPVAAPVGDRYGARGAAWHPGIDFPAPAGTPVAAARAGRVLSAGFASDGYGDRVVLAHGQGEHTLYAHLSKVLVRRGERVAWGAVIGRVGATGFATGPHLHFELIVRGAKIDPAPAMR